MWTSFGFNSQLNENQKKLELDVAVQLLVEQNIWTHSANDNASVRN